MAGPAMAVDYVKCEAMQAAYRRADNAETAVMANIHAEVSSKYERINCSINGEVTRYGGNYCKADAYKVYKKEIEKEVLSDPRLKPFSAKLNKIMADMKKAGCP